MTRLRPCMHAVKVHASSTVMHDQGRGHWGATDGSKQSFVLRIPTVGYCCDTIGTENIVFSSGLKCTRMN